MTKIDVSMHFHAFALDEESTWKCVIVTPFGKFRYLRLPMGLINSPAWAQGQMMLIFKDLLNDVEIYIDDVGIFSKDWLTHLTTVDRVLSILQAHNFTVKPQKCEWGVEESNWLGHWLTPIGIKPWKKTIEPILNME